MDTKLRLDRFAKAVLENNSDRIFEVEVADGQDPELLATSFNDLGCRVTAQPRALHRLTITIPLPRAPHGLSPFCTPSWAETNGPI